MSGLSDKALIVQFVFEKEFTSYKEKVIFHFGVQGEVAGGGFFYFKRFLFTRLYTPAVRLFLALCFYN